MNDVRSFSVRNCIDLALARNLDLQIKHLSTAIAGDLLNGSYGAYVPTFTFDALQSYESDLGNFDPRKFNPYFPAEITTDKLGSDLSGKIPYGFNYDFKGFVRKTAANTDFITSPEDAAAYPPNGIRSTNDYTGEAAVVLRQHLLKDFWIDADQEQVLIRRADLKVSRETLRFQIMQTLLAVEIAYYDLMDARDEIQVQEETVELRKQFVAETQRRVDLGASASLESAQAEAQLQNALTALAQARESFSTRQNHLISLITDDYQAWASVDVQLTDPLQADPTQVNRSASFQSALVNRPDLAEARLAVEKTGATVKFRLNQLFPTLDLVGGYGGQGVDPSDGISSLNDALSFSNPEYSFGAVVTFPLSNVSERNTYRASKAARQIAELQLKKAEQDVLVQVADCITRVESTYSQVTSTHKAATYAESALDAETKKLQNGFTTSFTVLQYQEILTAARTAEVRAKVDYNKTLAQLAFAEGSIMERNHLHLTVR